MNVKKDFYSTLQHLQCSGLIKGSVAAGLALLTAGCMPPTNIFTPNSGTHFNASSGTVVIAGLTQTTAACYTTDGSVPQWNNGNCAGATTKRFVGPVTFGQIPLSCGSDTGTDVQRTVNVVYDWTGAAEQSKTGTFFLNCGSDGGSGGGSDGGSGGGSDGGSGGGSDGGSGSGSDGGGSDGGSGGGSDDGSGGAGTAVLRVGQSLTNDQYLLANNGAYRFYLQGDGNLVLRDWQTRESLWSSGTHGEGGTRLILQNDSNLVLYTANNDPVWSSKTVGSGADRLVLNDNGTLSLYQQSSPVWSVGEVDSGGGSGDDGGSGGTGSISHVGTTEVYDSNGQNMRISRPSGSRSGDLLVLVLHRTDDYLPLNVSGWNRAAQCYKRDNGYRCVDYDDCTSWRDGNFCESFGDYGRGGRDLAQAIFYKRVGSSEPSSYTFNLNPDSDGHPGWAILTALRGANTSDPIRDSANTGCDNNPDSLFPSVYGRAGDMVLLSQSFDDAVAQSKFNPPDDTTTFGYVSQSDEAGFLFGGVLTSTGETGSMKTHGEGASNCKDALVSITIKSN